MLLPELKQLASSLGVKGTGGMRKSALIDAISGAQGGSRPATTRAESHPATTAPPDPPAADAAVIDDSTRGQRQPQAAPGGDFSTSPTQRSDQFPGDRDRDRGKQGDSRQGRNDDDGRDRSDGNNSQNQNRNDSRDRSDSQNQNRDDNRSRNDGRDGQNRDDGRGGSRSSRRRNRSRDRNRDRRRPEGNEAEPQVSEDDVLIPVAGILDLLDNYAFVRTSGYLPGPNDVYVSLSMVRKFGLRKGDAITGAVRQHHDADRKEKYNPIVRIDTVNGADPEAAKHRVDFSKLTPLYAAERLRLETEQNVLTNRIIDIVAPIGKGQRGLIVSPSKAGKTLILQAMANAITTNNPECHLMVVLVDERPEEVTDMQRAVKGEVVASTFDRPAEDHTTVAELAIERAKRLVELGHDVVVLLDSITRLGRAYNLAAPASGRILSGGVDSSALYPPKRFFGAARNIEDGGSLTILATALIETGSKMDEVIFEEFKGTGNMELRLRREFANKRIFPAIDVDASGTRREELLMSKDELQIVWKLRRVLSALDGQQALELLLEKLRSTKSNVDFLMQVNKTTPSRLRGSDDD
ncbi:MAG: transcription termination factor Rho [Nocardioidaceae bacterium]|nr:transcription termination factor Rho [Nocardioidaceae bacterium]